MNKLKDRKEFIVLAFIGLGAIFCMFYFSGRSDEAETAHHEEVKQILQTSIEKQDVAIQKQEQTDKSVQLVYKEVIRAGNAKYLKENAAIEVQKKKNKAYYDTIYSTIDSSRAAIVNGIVTDLIRRADSIGW